MTNDNENLALDWYLIEAWPGMMLTAKVEIALRRLEFLLPMTWRRAKVDGKDQPHASPRLPGNYAFVRLSSAPWDGEFLNEQASAVKTLRGVREVYKNASGSYSPARRDQIEGLRQIEAEEHREAGRAHPKTTLSRFKREARVRILRHDRFEGQEGEFLFSVRGEATVAMENGIKIDIPEFDLIEITKQARRRAG